eukprot:1552026-Pleurochrysis_carterae.AAC.1
MRADTVRKKLSCPRHPQTPALLRLEDFVKPTLLINEGDPVSYAPCPLRDERRSKLDVAVPGGSLAGVGKKRKFVVA